MSPVLRSLVMLFRGTTLTCGGGKIPSLQMKQSNERELFMGGGIIQVHMQFQSGTRRREMYITYTSLLRNGGSPWVRGPSLTGGNLM